MESIGSIGMYWNSSVGGGLAWVGQAIGVAGGQLWGGGLYRSGVAGVGGGLGVVMVVGGAGWVVGSAVWGGVA